MTDSLLRTGGSEYTDDKPLSEHIDKTEEEEEEEEGTQMDDDEDEICNTGIISPRRSEPDLTKISDSRQQNGNHCLSPRPFVPNDLDLIQSVLEHTGGIVPLTGSCPDLSEVQRDFLDEFWVLKHLYSSL